MAKDKINNNHEHSHNCSCGKEYVHTHAHNHCNCEHDDCNCEHEHEHNHTPKLVKMCVLEDGVYCTNCGACDICDLDENKICDNCGKCLDMLNTNDKGFVEIPIDKVLMGETADDELNQIFKLYGLDDDDEE